MRNLFVLSLALILGASALGSTGTPNFVEKKGYMEFTGRMIARPLQNSVLARRGLSPAQIQSRRANAVSLISPYVDGYRQITDEFFLDVPKGMTENQLARQLMATGLYQYVEPDWRVFPQQFVPNDPQYNQQWSHQNANSPEAWAIFRGSGTTSGVIIGITDTGLRRTHEDFNNPNNRVNGANTVQTTVRLESADPTVVNDLNGHGTHCASIAASVGNNGRGVAGVNLEARVMAIRVSDSTGGGSTITALTNGMIWAAQNGARVVSTSYSGVTSASVQTAGNTMKTTLNSLSFWAAGNAGANVSTGDHADVQIIGSINSSSNRSGFSNFGLNIDVMAPGESILAAYNGSDTQYANLSGTSMACPFAAGLAAMVIGFEPELTAQQVEDVVNRTAVDMGNQTNFGWGRVNLWNAIGRAPTAVNLTRGVLISGAAAEFRSQDGLQYTVQRGPVLTSTEAPVNYTIETVVPNFNLTTPSFRELRVRIADQVNTSGLRATVEAFRWGAGDWVSLGTYDPATTLTARSLRLTTGVNDVVRTSDRLVRVRITVRQVGPVLTSGWRHSVDLANLRVLREN